MGCSSSDNRILVKNSGEAQGSFYHIQYLSEAGINYKTQIDSILFLKRAKRNYLGHLGSHAQQRRNNKPKNKF